MGSLQPARRPLWAALACRPISLALVTAGLSACASWLPQGASQIPSSFHSFAQAQAALEQIVPFETTVAQLPGLGFDPAGGSNVTQVPYPEIAARLAPNPGVPLAAMDPGVRRCILAQTACRGFAFKFGEQKRDREGSFLLDFLNIKRVTHFTGWQFEALVVVADGVVLFRNFGGEPHTDRTEQQLNPLGPFQPAGESAGRSLLR